MYMVKIKLMQLRKILLDFFSQLEFFLLLDQVSRHSLS